MIRDYCGRLDVPVPVTLKPNLKEKCKASPRNDSGN
jgi:hypothetical protein